MQPGVRHHLLEFLQFVEVRVRMRIKIILKEVDSFSPHLGDHFHHATMLDAVDQCKFLNVQYADADLALHTVISSNAASGVVIAA